MRKSAAFVIAAGNGPCGVFYFRQLIGTYGSKILEAFLTFSRELITVLRRRGLFLKNGKIFLGTKNKYVNNLNKNR